MDRSIPVPGELIPRCAVPPVGVEASIGKAGEFRQDVEHAFPYDVPGQEILHHEREEEIGECPWKFFQSLPEGYAVLFLCVSSAYGPSI